MKKVQTKVVEINTHCMANNLFVCKHYFRFETNKRVTTQEFCYSMLT